MLETFLEFFNSGGWSIWGPFLLLVICGFGLPLPEDISLVAAGILASQFNHNLYGVIILMYIGVLIGDSTIYFLGKYYGPQFQNSKLGRKIVTENNLKKINILFEKYGGFVIFIGRFLPGIRTPMFFTTGSIRYPFLRFVCLDFAAASFSVAFWVWLGFWGSNKYGHEFSQLKTKMGQTQFVVLLVAVISIVFLFYKFKADFKLEKNK